MEVPQFGTGVKHLYRVWFPLPFPASAPVP